MTPAIVEELWEYSPAKGSSLLLLLAIARHANHDGTGAYPSLATLKRLTRLSHSQVCLLLRQLEGEGHLSVTHGGGPGGTNAYTILRTWDTQAHPKIGHAKTAHARARPKIGPNQEPKRKRDPGGFSDVLTSDIRSSDQPPAPVVTQAAAHWLRTIAQDLSPDFAQALQGTPAQEPPAPRAKTPRQPALYFQGKLCPGGHDDGTGHTLRRVKNGNCTECDVARTKAKRQAQAAIRKAQTPKPARQVIDLAAHRQRQGG